MLYVIDYSLKSISSDILNEILTDYLYIIEHITLYRYPVR